MQSYRLYVLHDSSVVGKINSVYNKDVVSGRCLYISCGLEYNYFEPWIYQNYYGLPIGYGENKYNRKDYNKAHVTVHRAINNMEAKGLIEVNRYYINNMKNWSLTEKGIGLAAKLFATQ